MPIQLNPALQSNVTLSTILGICNEFKRYHYQWPTTQSTEHDFNNAHIAGVNGLVLHALLRTGKNGLSDDPQFNDFYHRCIKIGYPHASLEALDPKIRLGLLPKEATDLMDAIQFSWKLSENDPSNRPPNSMRISLAHDIRVKAYELASMQRWMPGTGRVTPWVPLTKTLKDTLKNAGVVHEVNGQNFYLELNDAGYLYAKYETILGSRYLHESTPAMRDKITELYARSIVEHAISVGQAISPETEAFMHRTQPGQRSLFDAPAPVAATPKAPASGLPKTGVPDLDQLAGEIAGNIAKADKIMRSVAKKAGVPVPGEEAAPAAPVTSRHSKEVMDELALLTAEGNAILLPPQQLTQYAKIKSLITTAGGKYVSRGAKFTFSAGFDASAILATLQGGSVSNDKKVNQFFATPADLAEEVVDDAGPCKGKRFLEPSAGDGALADIARARGAEVVTIENWDVNVIKLKGKGYEPIQRDFMTVTPEEIGYFDAIIANPPFTKGQDIQHITHMLNFLKPGGNLSAIMSTGWQRGTQKKQVAFQELLEQHGAKITQVEAGAFSESGTTVPTLRVVFSNYQPINRQGMEEEEEIDTEEMTAPTM